MSYKKIGYSNSRCAKRRAFEKQGLAFQKYLRGELSLAAYARIYRNVKP